MNLVKLPVGGKIRFSYMSIYGPEQRGTRLPTHPALIDLILACRGATHHDVNLVEILCYGPNKFADSGASLEILTTPVSQSYGNNPTLMGGREGERGRGKGREGENNNPSYNAC